MSEKFSVACVQVNAGSDLQRNIAEAGALVRAARAAGADLIVLPENVAFLELRGGAVRAHARPEDQHPALSAFQDLARETGAWLLAGSIAVSMPNGKIANRSILLDPQARIVGRYDKIHMFDVDLPSGESYRESEAFEAGDAAVVCDTPWGPLGLTVCYDLRFGALYRSLALAGARYLTVPAAFTKVTGEAHWHVLLRARAIENGCFVFAPNQCGQHSGKHEVYGHSLIVSPWGEVLADGGEEVGFITAEIDPALVDKARGAIPALEHGKPFRSPLDEETAA
jgi:predicted amidohydrolase